MIIGDKVKPSKACRPLYGDPEIMTIIDIICSKVPAYVTDTYPEIFFKEDELQRVNQLISAQEALKELDDMDVPHYKGDGNHSVLQLEKLCRDFTEYIHQSKVKETYTREEVYLIAHRSTREVINNIWSKGLKTISEIINSEIDTVKLF